MFICCDRQSTKSATELVSLLDPQVKKPAPSSSWRAARCLCLPVCIIVIFSTACIVLSTQVQRKSCTITCTHRPNCTVLIGNRTYHTQQGSCSWREQVAQCKCYIADDVVSVNPFILLSPMWTLVAALSGGALALFTLGLCCWCLCKERDRHY